MRIRPTATLAAATASLLNLSGVTYAAVQSVDPNPDAQVVIPNLHTPSPHPSRSAEQNRGHGKDDPAAHDSADDHSSGGRGSDDPSAGPGDGDGDEGGGRHDRDKGEPGGGGDKGGKPTPHPSRSGSDDHGGGGHGGGHEGD